MGRWRWRGRGGARPRGQSTVELALILPVVVILLLGAVDFAQVLSVQQRLEHAAHLATLRLLKDPSLDLASYIAAESGLTPVSAGSAYSVAPDGADQVVVTATYAYPLLMPGLRNLQTRSITDGKLHISIQTSGIAASSPPTVTVASGGGGSSTVTVDPPSDHTTPSGLSLSCTLYKNGAPLTTRSPCVSFSLAGSGSDYYTATATQVNGVTSPPSARVQG